MEVKRPALKYPGGKWRDGRWVIGHMPPHEGYVEVCGGGGNVLLRKQRVKSETFNEIDEEVTTYFEVLRNPAERDELLEALHWTPWSEAEYGRSFEQAVDRVERARRCFVRAWMGFGGYSRYQNGFRFVKNYGTRVNPAQSDLVDVSHLHAVGERFRGVQILCRDAMEIIEKFGRTTQLLYVDPPYVAETRENPTRYKFEWSREQHVEAAALLRKAKGPVLVSGYVHELYVELYEEYGWRRVEKVSRSNGGGDKIEAMWLNENAQRRALF